MSRFNVGALPGIQAKVTTQERQVWWGHENLQIRDPNPTIDSAAADAGNSPTTVLRAGLIMAKVTATGRWREYDPTATDGREVARGVLLVSLPMLNMTTLVVENKQGQILIGGLLKHDHLLGLDSFARIQLSERFIFDDDIPGRGWGGSFLRESAKTANYAVVAADNFTEFTNVGAAGTVVFTLPAIGKGYRFKFRAEVAQTLTVASAEGDNMVALNDASADSVSLQTAGAIIGGGFIVYSNAAGTKWIVEQASAGANTVTVAT